MFGLKHITDEELRRYYYLEGQISGNVKNINILNGIHQDYVGSKINDFITWHDDCGKIKFQLYVKENLSKMETDYEKIVKEKQREEKEREERELKIKHIIGKLSNSPISHDTKIHILNKFNISEIEYNKERDKIRNLSKIIKKIEKQKKIEKKKEIEYNKFIGDIQNKLI
jgi:hypothetical protein